MAFLVSIGGKSLLGAVVFHFLQLTLQCGHAYGMVEQVEGQDVQRRSQQDSGGLTSIPGSGDSGDGFLRAIPL